MTKDNTPAFPVFPETSAGHAVAFTGMTLRDYFAAKTLPALIAGNDTTAIKLAMASYELADAMMEARKV